MKGLKQRLQKGEAVIGTFLSLANSLTTEILAKVGFDLDLIDIEHRVVSEYYNGDRLFVRGTDALFSSNGAKLVAKKLRSSETLS